MKDSSYQNEQLKLKLQSWSKSPATMLEYLIQSINMHVGMQACIDAYIPTRTTRLQDSQMAPTPRQAPPPGKPMAGASGGF